MKDELEKKKKVAKLKEFAKAAGAGGAKEAVKGTLKATGKTTISNKAREVIGEATGKSIGQKAKELFSKVKGTTTIRKGGSDLGDRDAQTERNVGKKYKDISPVMGKGSFNRNTPKDNWGNTGITQDEVDRKRKK